MRNWILTLILSLWIALPVTGQQIDAAEYFFDVDPGVGFGTAITVVSGTPVDVAEIISAAALDAGLHDFYLRYQDDAGHWSAAAGYPFYILDPPALTRVSHVITEAELHFDNGAPTVVDLPDGAEVSLSEVVGTAGLDPGLHILSVVYRDDANQTSAAHGRAFYILDLLPSALVNHVITEAELRIDGGDSIVVDVIDGATVSLTEIVGSAGLEPGVHVLSLGFRDELGNLSAAPGGFFYVFRPFANAPEVRNIVEAEIFVDGESVSVIDVVDQPLVLLSEIMSSNGITVGDHTVSVRYRDDTGVWSRSEGRFIFAFREIPPPMQMKTLTGAEYYINVDPGVGNGIPLLPADGVWDEGTEILTSAVSGIPLGRHLVGIRFQDNDGFWTQTLVDTFWVGPVVTVRVSGSDAVLNWITGADATLFHVFHDTLSTGNYTELGTTADTTFTHSGILDTQEQGFYYITQESGAALSTYRRPDLRPESAREQR